MTEVMFGRKAEILNRYAATIQGQVRAKWLMYKYTAILHAPLQAFI